MSRHMPKPRREPGEAHLRGLMLPGGALINLRGYLPDKTCRRCSELLQAGMFLRAMKSKDGRKRYDLDERHCAWCGGRNFPAELLPMRLEGLLVTDTGQAVGWRERNKDGCFGPPLRLDTMQFRLLDGVIRPQPKFNRRKGALPLSRNDGTRRLLRDSQRSFSRSTLQAAIERQHHRCYWCGRPETPEDPFVAGHDWPHARGGSSRDPNNCIAVHASCNRRQRDMTVDEFRKWLKSRRPLLDDAE